MSQNSDNCHTEDFPETAAEEKAQTGHSADLSEQYDRVGIVSRAGCLFQE